MIEFSPTVFVSFLGLFAGVLGVCIAIWLQMIMKRRCDSRNVLIFFIFGCALILMNLEPIGANGNGAFAGRVAAYIILIVGEILSGYHVYKNSPITYPSDVYEDVFDSDSQ